MLSVRKVLIVLHLLVQAVMFFMSSFQHFPYQPTEPQSCGSLLAR